MLYISLFKCILDFIGRQFILANVGCKVLFQETKNSRSIGRAILLAMAGDIKNLDPVDARSFLCRGCFRHLWLCSLVVNYPFQAKRLEGASWLNASANIADCSPSFSFTSDCIPQPDGRFAPSS